MAKLCRYPKFKFALINKEPARLFNVIDFQCRQIGRWAIHK